jgi:hypothetical protein
VLAFAYVLALLIGWDREHNERSAGLRTFPLVAVASGGFIQATEGITGNSPEAQYDQGHGRGYVLPYGRGHQHGHPKRKKSFLVELFE